MKSLSRRGFLKGTAAAAASTVVGCASSKQLLGSRSVPRFRRPGEKLNLGVIAVGRRGWENWTTMFRLGENVVALCDIDRTQIDRGLKHIEASGRPKADVKCFSDYRKMLETCKNLDAVVISTPDHMHCPAAIQAMNMGCHVYVEKPLVRTIWEAHYFEKVAKANGVMTQMGNHGSAADGFRRNVEVLQHGVLGDVKEVHVWTNRPVWPQGIRRPEGADPVPDNIDWDCWLGTAREAPFKEGVYHTFKWRGFFDYGTGAFGDMACHTMNLPFRGLKLGAVTAAECLSIEGKNPDTYPSKSIVKLTYAARGNMPAVNLFWYDGELKPSAELMPQVIETMKSVPKTGCLIIGDKGILVSTNDYGAAAYIGLNGEKKVSSVGKSEACDAIPKSFTKAGGHQQEFVAACKGETKCFSDIEHSIPLLEGMLVGCIAQQIPGTLNWNSATRTFGKPEADALLKPYVRKGWEF